MKHTIKITPQQLNKIKLYWSMAQAENARYWARLGNLERKMSKAVGIEDMEIFHCDGEMCGIGNYDRTMALIQRKALETSRFDEVLEKDMPDWYRKIKGGKKRGNVQRTVNIEGT